MGYSLSKEPQEVVCPPLEQLNRGVWLVAAFNMQIPFQQSHLAITVNGRLYELRGGTGDGKSFGNDGLGDYRLGCSPQELFESESVVGGVLPMMKKTKSVRYYFWQASSSSSRTDDDVYDRACWFRKRWPVYSAHHVNCHKLALSLLNYACDGIDEETHGFLDGCLKIASNYHRSNANWITPYKRIHYTEQLPEHDFLIYYPTC